MITIDISPLNPELLAIHEGDPSGADLEDYLYRKFEREVPDDCRELKIYTGFRDYDFNQRRRLTFLDSDLSQLLDKTRLTSLETIIFHGSCFNHIVNFEWLNELPALRNVHFDIFEKKNDRYYSFISGYTNITNLSLMRIPATFIPNVLENLTHLEGLKIVSPIKLKPGETKYFNTFPNLRHLDIIVHNKDFLPRLLAGLDNLESLNLSLSRFRDATLDFTSLTKLKKLDITKVGALKNLILPPSIERLEAKGGKDILKFWGNYTLPELNYLDVSESKQNIAFNRIPLLTNLYSIQH